jgi:phospholipase/lecithinase/hemolysin
MRSSRRAMQLALCFLALLILPVQADTQKYDALFAFGDSLADNGNDFAASQGAVPPSVPPHRTYFNGRFSNGYNAVEVLWHMVGGGAPGSPTGLTPILALQAAQQSMPLNGGTSFAFGGTGTGDIDQTPGGAFLPGLQGQVQIFRQALGNRTVPKKSLFVIITGTNDYLAFPPTNRQPSDVARNIVRSLQVLYDAGARDVLIMDIPDLGAVPNANPAQTAITVAHNAALDAALGTLDGQKKMQIYRGRFADAFATLPAGIDRTTPAIEVFAPGQSGCLFFNPAGCPNLPDAAFTPSLPYVFWDIVHPTAGAHDLLAQYFYDVLAHRKAK